jgi:hypothetical protein
MVSTDAEAGAQQVDLSLAKDIFVPEEYNSFI